MKDGFILWLLGPTSICKTTIATECVKKARKEEEKIISNYNN